MQFSCESCKATLHIGDEKVKGKRLVVRCKKCGARIQIADPALGPAPAGAAPLSQASAPPPALSSPPKSAPAPAAVAPRPATLPDGPKAAVRERDSDTESTQAMDSGVLEQALAASKVDDATSGAGLARVVVNGRGPVVAEPVAAPAAPGDPAIWFAMVSGKQIGPLSRAELGLKAAQGQVTARTYLWKESMGGWQRAQELRELSSLFAGAPAAKPAPAVAKPAPAKTPTPPADNARTGPRDFSDLGSLQLDVDPRRGKQRMEPQFTQQEFGTLPLVDDSPQGSGMDLALELDLPQRGGRAVVVPTRPAPAPAVSKAPAPVSRSLPRQVQSDPSVPVNEDDVHDEDRTHVEPLPLGERVHQEAVANELFNSSTENSPVAVTAKDLASWASREMGKRPTTQPTIPKAPVPTNPALPRAAGAKSGTTPSPEGAPPTSAASAPAAARDPFAAVPDAPGFSMPNPVDTTGNIIARSGLKKKRTGTLVVVIGGGALILLALFFALTSGKNPPPAAPGEAEPQRQALGGTGESVSGLTKGPTAPAAPGADATKGPAAKKVGASSEKQKADEAQEQADAEAQAKAQQEQAQNAQALANLDNERGIGNHGPKADAAPAVPETAKAETSLSARDIRKKLDENKGALQGCIDDALHKEPGLKVGKIHIATTIAASGVVTAAKIDKPAVDDSPLGVCLKKATRRIVFPSFSGDAFEVDIPILVTAGD